MTHITPHAQTPQDNANARVLASVDTRHDLARTIAAAWGLHPLHIMLGPSEHDHITFTADDCERRLFFRLDSGPAPDPSPAAEITRVKFCALARAHGIATAVALRARNGRYRLRVKDRSLTAWQPIDGHPVARPDADMLLDAARRQAHLHALSGVFGNLSPIVWPGGLRHLLHEFLSLNLNASGLSPSAEACSQSILQLIGDLDLNALDRPAGLRGLCHFDYQPSNLIARRGGAPVVVDFDDMAYGALSMDLGVALWHWTRAMHPGNDFSEAQQSALASYLDAYAASSALPGTRADLAEAIRWAALRASVRQFNRLLRLRAREFSLDVEGRRRWLDRACDWLCRV